MRIADAHTAHRTDEGNRVTPPPCLLLVLMRPWGRGNRASCRPQFSQWTRHYRHPSFF